MPEKGKLCNFDCIYCECGWNRDGREDRVLPDAATVRAALENKLGECLLDGVQIDSITFAGDGEPTINPDFARIIDDTLKLRDVYYPDAKVSVLSNATMVRNPRVLEALKKVDNPIMKIDAPTNALAAIINKPVPGYDVGTVVDSLKQFDGNFVLQTMFLKGGGFDSSSPEVLDGWMEIVRTLKPREIMVYTIDRPTPQEGLQKFTEEQMKELVAPLVEDGFKIQIKA